MTRLCSKRPEIRVLVDLSGLDFLDKKVRQSVLVLQQENDLLQMTERDDFMLEELTAGVNRRGGEVACGDE